MSLFIRYTYGVEDNKLIFSAAFEGLRKDREGEIKLTLAIPASDEHIVRDIPTGTSFKVAVIDEHN